LSENVVKGIDGGRWFEPTAQTQKSEVMLMKKMEGFLFFLLLSEAIGCSGSLESQETFSQQKKRKRFVNV
jgi:hypothetical protein